MPEVSAVGRPNTTDLNWIHSPLALLALWLLASPATLGYGHWLLNWNAWICGAALLLLIGLNLKAQSPTRLWIMTGLGVWLTLAPIALSAPTAAVYLNETMTGLLIVVLAGVVPTILDPADGTDVAPARWSYNPSTWSGRIPIIGLAFVGFLIARYMAAYQLGHIREVWDPFFKTGTERVLESRIARAFPVSDAGLGAWAYLMDGLLGAMGGVCRWRRSPWIVITFGLLVIPSGAVSLTLVILQPIAVGTWCTLCLLAASILLLMVPPAVDEVVATVEFLTQSHKAGRPFWRTFWTGGPPVEETGQIEKRTSTSPWFAFPWHLTFCSALGLWLMTAPALMQLRGFAADSCHLTGALVTTFSIIAHAEAARPIRFINLLAALWLVIGSWFLPLETAEILSLALIGLLIYALTLPLGKITERHGSFDRLIYRYPGIVLGPRRPRKGWLPRSAS